MTRRAAGRRALAALALLAAAAPAGCGDDSGAPLAWDGQPLVIRQPELPHDTIVTGRVRNGSGEELRLDSARVRIVDARGRAVRSTATFAAGVTHSLYPPRDAPRENPRAERERLGVAATVPAGGSVPFTVAWRTRRGAPAPVRVELGPAALELPRGR